jgi:hypothetical protein
MNVCFSILFKNRQKRLTIFCKHLTWKQCGISKIRQLIFNKFHLGPSLREKLKKQSSSGKFCERKLTRKKRWFFCWVSHKGEPRWNHGKLIAGFWKSRSTSTLKLYKIKHIYFFKNLSTCEKTRIHFFWPTLYFIRQM